MRSALLKLHNHSRRRVWGLWSGTRNRALAAIVGLVTACGSVYEAPAEDILVLVDPYVEDYGGTATYEPTGEPQVELGFYSEQLYEPLRQGGECFVVAGLQGGRWTMPALRVKGMDYNVNVDLTVTTESGERVGEVSVRQRLVLANDAWLEVQALPVPIAHAAPNEAEELDDLYGQVVEIELSVEDKAGRRVHQTLSAVLEKG